MTEPNVAAAVSPRGGPRVLVVDDSLTIRLYCRRALQAAGFEVAEAENGLEGLEMALRAAPQLMTVDINMQKMDGYALMREVRRQPGLIGVPAIMMSTEGEERDVERAFAAGANFFIAKPVDAARLVAVARLMCGVPAP